jgi:hypothetical protein
MARLEKNVVAAIRKYLNAQACCTAVKLHGGPMQTAGLPDLIILWRRGFVEGGRRCIAFVEVKGPTRAVTPLQAQWLRKLGSLGFTTGVARNVEDVQRIMDQEERGFDEQRV